jgi:protein-S-isoprenylcysteine O-methyltransferase Ste14
MENKVENDNKYNIHKVLAHSYTVFFLLFLVGVSLDMIFRLKIFSSPAMAPLGSIIIIFATVLIFWAQMTSRNLKKENLTRESFCKGPYCYTRSPTHWGLFLLILGFGIITNALFVILSSIISFIVTKLIFLKKEEEILAEKYGAPYLEYKKSVRF